MVNFEIYTKQVEVIDAVGNTNTFTIRPLSGRWLPKLYRVLKKLSPENKDDTTNLKNIDEEAMGELHELVFETMKKSYPKEDTTILDEFCAQNLMSLVQPLVEVNMGKAAADNDNAK
jgi:hypothetical protein